MNSQKKKRLRRMILGSLAFSAIALSWNQFSFLRKIEQSTLDARYRNFNREQKASDRVVVIEIDEGSLQLLAESYGRWPFPRNIYRELLEFVSLGKPKALFFDLLFSEEEKGNHHDQELAETSTQFFVSHAMQLLNTPTRDLASGQTHRALPEGFESHFSLNSVVESDPSTFDSATNEDFVDHSTPARAYLDKIEHVHVVSVKQDSDGIYRRYPLIHRYEKGLYPSLALEAFRAEHPDLKIQKNPLTLKWANGEIRIPNERGYLRLHFYGNPKNPVPFKSYSLAEVLASRAKLVSGEVEDPAQLRVDPRVFENKFVLLGGSAVGLEDTKATPMSKGLPGVYLHATALSNLLLNDQLHRVPTWINVLYALALVALTYTFVLFTEQLWMRLLPPFLFWLFGAALALFLFKEHSIWLGMALPFTAFIASLIDAFTYLSLSEGREKRKFRSTLSKYLSPTVMEDLMAAGSDPRAEVGLHKELSILFSDIRGFTTLSERLSPDRVVRVLNEYLGRMTDVIFETQGTLDKFIGDAIMAFWGAPLEQPDHAERALRCALKMKEALHVLKAEWAAKGGDTPDLKVGIGINTGEVIVGNIGSEKRLDYTVIGDNVNLASRLEGLTKHYKVTICVGERTFAKLRDQAACRIIDKVRVVGKNQPVRIYEPLAMHDEPGYTRALELARSFNTAWELYELGNFSEARRAFDEYHCSCGGDDGLSALYIERCDRYLSVPPPQWDGVFKATEK